MIFTGDELESDQVLINDPRKISYASVELSCNNMKKLQARIDEFDMICLASSGSPMHVNIIDSYLENCERIMSGIDSNHIK